MIVRSGRISKKRRSCSATGCRGTTPSAAASASISRSASPARCISTAASRRRVLAEITVKNITEVSPTTYFNVPAGYSGDPAASRARRGAAKKFFAAQMIFYAGASLPQDLWERLENLSVQTTGARVPMTTAWGTTETSPLSMRAFSPTGPGVIGVPCLGVETKLVPSGNKLEIRVRGRTSRRATGSATTRRARIRRRRLL